jgi:DNA helicase HerA-like ATPase
MLARKKEEMLALEKGADYLNILGKRDFPLVWLFIDEMHEFLPKETQDKTAATDALIQILREGRQPGISLVMATQQPGVIHRDAMTQSDIVISHRLTAQPDIEALNLIMQTYLLESIRTSMASLPGAKGSAIVLDDNSERIYQIRVRPKFTWHGGEAPSAIKAKKGI